jgi:hypothetical protein
MTSGDQFTLKEWADAMKKPSSLPAHLSTEVLDAFSVLRAACEKNNVPMVAAFVAADGTKVFSSLGSKPENVPADMMMGRAALKGDMAETMTLASSLMTGFGMKL